ncbi:chemotaxis response regulator protein-glutamate methylesterase [Desulfosporosinus sp.]|uniref:protein-glutamate methylesterase/protein-glutamine glutaminase n=1 Tax=Desulfosporosinus sp. TaxID=157907 RepID=UPI0025BC8F71|nr:chemotaxis response regulator protein-glutamate methylesterase [Desulfosporosinus sp.]MBC2721910.1 chemotaxis response regulator protein-glutamate methylesterase [Desulfosporosinus sp.]MBC2728855.1 chemotaxis response regulator protein-glutamate methylesterase [Desulfosporosinus sp.]
MTSAHRAQIGVLIVDDSPFMRLTLQKILNQDPGIKVLDTAKDGREGILKLQSLRPDVVTMDVEMPIMDGLQALDEIMRWQPTSVIILSAVTTEGAQSTLKALDLGAIDVVAKPSGKPGADLQAFSRDLIDKVKAAALVNPARLKPKEFSAVSANSPTTNPAASPSVITAPAPAVSPETVKTGSGIHAGISKAVAPKSSLNKSSGLGSRAVSTGKVGMLPKHAVEIVAIGTSTGGPSALQAVLPTLPRNFPVPVLVAQHMPPGFTGPLAQRLNGLCALNVREGVHGEALKAGTVYVAPAGKQLQVQRRSGQLILNIGNEAPIPTLYHPSIDVMFLSLGKEVGKGTLGVVMTGMGSDGTKGMKELKKLEGFAIAEAEETCVVYGMPRSLVDAGLADRVVPLGEIGKAIVECVMRRG